MWNSVGIIRTEEGLKNAQKEVNILKQNFKRRRKCLNKDEYEYRNMLTVAGLIVEGAISRHESRGAHCRSDFRETSKTAMASMIQTSSLAQHGDRLLSSFHATSTRAR